MRAQKTRFAIVSLVAAGATVVFGATVAHAEVEDSVDQALVDSSLTYLGLENVTDELSGFLEEGMDAATDAGIVPNELIDSVAGVGETPLEGEQVSPEPSSEPAVLDPALEQLFDEQLDLDQQRWDDAGPLWLAAFETIRAEFEVCREDGQTTSVCARTMAFSLQIAQADALLAELDDRIAAIDSLPVEQQEQLRAELEAERIALEARLLRAEARLNSISAPAGADSDRVVALLATVRERAQGAQGATPGQAANPNLTDQVPANPGAPAQQGTPSQKPVTPNSAATPGGRPDAGSTPGSQGNRPQAPGSNAGNSGNNGAGR